MVVVVPAFASCESIFVPGLLAVVGVSDVVAVWSVVGSDWDCCEVAMCWAVLVAVDGRIRVASRIVRRRPRTAPPP
jgi:hypothetical protein